MWLVGLLLDAGLLVALACWMRSQRVTGRATLEPPRSAALTWAWAAVLLASICVDLAVRGAGSR